MKILIWKKSFTDQYFSDSIELVTWLIQYSDDNTNIITNNNRRGSSISYISWIACKMLFPRIIEKKVVHSFLP